MVTPLSAYLTVMSGSQAVVTCAHHHGVHLCAHLAGSKMADEWDVRLLLRDVLCTTTSPPLALAWNHYKTLEQFNTKTWLRRSKPCSSGAVGWHLVPAGHAKPSVLQQRLRV